jgi:hypothetical protein
MTAQVTAQRVLAWAVRPAGLPPEGPLWEAGRLAEPEPATVALVAELARATAARLGAGTPPFADHSPIGAGPVLLAAAVGGRQQAGSARQLAEALPAARPARMRSAQACWPDLIARHGLAACAVASRGAPGVYSPVTGDLVETLLRMSPLTATFYRPPLSRLSTGATGDEVEAAAALVGRPRGQAVLAAALANWVPEQAVLDWRVELLDRLAHDFAALVLDTYALARLRHGADWDLRVAWARKALLTPGPADPLAISTIRFWVPLARLSQRGVRLPDARPLMVGYRPALELVRHYRLLTAGAA